MNLEALKLSVLDIMTEASAVARGTPRKIGTGPNPSTDLDARLHDLLTSRLRAVAPFDVLSEEAVAQPITTDWTWVIDPLDGTLNAIAGTPDTSISVALVEAESRVPVLGVVSAPHLNSTYAAVAGHGAELNGEALTGLSPRAPLLAYGLPALSQRHGRELGETLGRLIEDGWILRQTGSAALDLCRAAASTWLGFYEPSVMVWDVAAGVVVAREAGLRVMIGDPSVSTPAPELSLDLLALHDTRELDVDEAWIVASVTGTSMGLR